MKTIHKRQNEIIEKNEIVTEKLFTQLDELHQCLSNTEELHRGITEKFEDHKWMLEQEKKQIAERDAVMTESVLQQVKKNQKAVIAKFKETKEKLRIMIAQEKEQQEQERIQNKQERLLKEAEAKQMRKEMKELMERANNSARRNQADKQNKQREQQRIAELKAEYQKMKEWEERTQEAEEVKSEAIKVYEKWLSKREAMWDQTFTAKKHSYRTNKDDVWEKPPPTLTLF